MSSATRKVLICRSINDAVRGGLAEEVERTSLLQAYSDLRLYDPHNASGIEDPNNPGEPICPLEMPKSIRLLAVSHRGQRVGVVIQTFKGGGEAQRAGIVSQGDTQPTTRNNLSSFFR